MGELNELKGIILLRFSDVLLDPDGYCGFLKIFIHVDIYRLWKLSDLFMKINGI